MTRRNRGCLSVLACCLALAAACAAEPLAVGQSGPARLPGAPLRSAPAASAVAQIAFQQTDVLSDSAASGGTGGPLALELVQPPTIAEAMDPAEIDSRPEPLPRVSGWTQSALEQMALGNNPAIAQAAARVRALRGKWVQVGLAPNPTVGYLGSEIGNAGAAGQQGGFLGQNFITAQKLDRNRAVVAAEIDRAQQLLAATQRRVLTDVRLAYYGALLAQRRVELARDLLHAATEAVDASQSLYEAKEIPLAGLLQTEVQQQNAQMLLRTGENGLAQAWRRLAAVVGSPGLPVEPLEGDVSRLPEPLDWDEQLARLQTQSPEIAVALADVLRARRALSRACVEAVPNIQTQLSVQYDDATQDTIAGVQIGLPLPLWNRNQGGIRQAHAEVARASRNVDRIELHLNRQLADEFRDYSNAYVTAQTYAADILPRAQRTFELVQRGYRGVEVGYLDLLAAQRTFSQTNLAYLDALTSLWQSYLRIDGLLLDGSLASQRP